MNTSEYDAFLRGFIAGGIVLGPVFAFFAVAFIRWVGRAK